MLPRLGTKKWVCQRCRYALHRDDVWVVLQRGPF
jgi:hypothetical protein